MSSRREFLIKTGLASSLAFVGLSSISFKSLKKPSKVAKGPIVVSTWNFGIPANEAAMKVLAGGGRALDAVEAGVRVPEGDPAVTSVGYGGLPDYTGKVTLDSCIMDETGNCGSVAFLQHIKHPISVARKVMEDTEHIMLVGVGALNFAIAKGFRKDILLTKGAEKTFMDHMSAIKKAKYDQIKRTQEEDHDTIGMLALDKDGNLSGACTTSGLAWKMHGRVGDSPIIGAGLFVDNEIGAATATGRGEAVIKTAGTFLVVELMRQGKTPQEACEIAVQRIVDKQTDYKDFQVGFLALSSKGETGAYSLKKGFQYAIHNGTENKLIDAEFKI